MEEDNYCILKTIKRKTLSIIGGDLRLVYLAKLFAKDKNNIVYTYAQEESYFEEKNIIITKNLEESIEKSEVVIGPIPFTKDKKNLNTPFSKNIISINNLFENLSNKTLIAGNIPQEYLNYKNIKIIDIMKNEELTILNTIATAEGAIEQIILNTNTTIQGSNILILGFGRVAKTLALKLKLLDAKITCAARRIKSMAWIETYGFYKLNIENLNENLENFDVIINTVPDKILTKKELNYIKKQTTIIELASLPGGIDRIYAQKIGLKCILALGLPGKVAPYTTAKYIKNSIEKIKDY